MKYICIVLKRTLETQVRFRYILKVLSKAAKMSTVKLQAFTVLFMGKSSKVSSEKHVQITGLNSRLQF